MSLISIDVLGDLAYDKVKEMILSNELVAGQKIVQDKLAEALGISRTPLRNALNRLEAEYLVESVPRRGVFVKQFDDREVVEIYDCRVALESMAITLFTDVASDKEVEGLASIFLPFVNQKGAIDLTVYSKADLKFHETIIDKCQNSFLNKLVTQGNLLSCIDRIGLVRPPEETLQEHLDIIRAIQERNPKKAEELCKDHLLKSKTLILEKLENEG